MKKYLYTMLIVAISLILTSVLLIILFELIDSEEVRNIVIGILILVSSIFTVIIAIYVPKRITKNQNFKKLHQFLGSLSIDHESMFERIAFYFMNGNADEVLKFEYQKIEIDPRIYEYGTIELSVKLIRENFDTILLSFNKDTFTIYIFDQELTDKSYDCFSYSEYNNIEEIFDKIHNLCSDVK